MDAEIDKAEQRRRHLRMVNDGAFIIDHAWWPFLMLHVKTQPWWDGPEEFGLITRNQKTRVINKDPKGLNDHFDSISMLVEKWSVDRDEQG